MLLRRLAGAAYIAAVVALGMTLLAVWLSWRTSPPRSVEHGRSALWAGHRWVGDPLADDEYARLARRLVAHRIDDVFFHVGPLDAEGRIPPARYPHAGALVDAMRRHAPTVRTQAYIGQVERRGGGPLDLDRPDVRQNIADTAVGFLDLGFGGIHYDIEPIYPGDRRFLDVLTRTRAAMAGRGVLSVALEQVEVVRGVQRLVQRAVDRYHDPTAAYLETVADHVDQVAIMTYDTGLPTDWLFGAFTAWQTERVARLVADEVDVLIGVPTYEEGHFWGFHPSAENMRSGVRGVRKGLSRLPPHLARRTGPAFYAEWTTSEAEWAEHRRQWVS